MRVTSTHPPERDVPQDRGHDWTSHGYLFVPGHARSCQIMAGHGRSPLSVMTAHDRAWPRMTRMTGHAGHKPSPNNVKHHIHKFADLLTMLANILFLGYLSTYIVRLGRRWFPKLDVMWRRSVESWISRRRSSESLRRS